VLFREFKLEHIQYITPHSVQTEEYKWLLTPGVGSLLLTGVAVSGWADGRCVGAAGIVPVHQGRGEAWMILSEYARDHVHAIVKQTRKVLDESEFKRVDCTTQVNVIGNKIAKVLGFELEARLEAYGVNSEDMHLWKRVKR